MYLTELTKIATEDLPIPEFRAHLHLGTGFSDDNVQDALLERTLRAAIAQVEGLCTKALIARDFVWTVHAWGDLSRLVLPRAPLRLVDTMTIVDPDNRRHVVDAERYNVDRDAHRPGLIARSFTLPQIPVGGHAEIAFQAGFGSTWDSIPADLGLATIMLAAAQYEDRTALGTISPGVQNLLAPYRPRRLLGGF